MRPQAWIKETLQWQKAWGESSTHPGTKHTARLHLQDHGTTHHRCTSCWLLSSCLLSTCRSASISPSHHSPASATAASRAFSNALRSSSFKSRTEVTLCSGI